jgi:predicted amidophosphoribosyltransferase
VLYDIMSTSTTLDELTGTLKADGAARVNICALARALKA